MSLLIVARGRHQGGAVTLPNPRDRSGQEFVGLERRIKDLVREEVMKLGVV